MKKLSIYASVVGLGTGIVYLLYKKRKFNNTVSETVSKKEDFETKHQEKKLYQETDIEEEMHQDKSESAQAVYERHSEASSIMKDAYSNIMEDFVEDFSDEEVAKEKEIIVDSESVSVMKELDSVSDELDDLLK